MIELSNNLYFIDKCKKIKEEKRIFYPDQSNIING